MLFWVVISALYIYFLIDLIKIFTFLDRSTLLTLTELLECADKLRKIFNKTTLLLVAIILVIGFLKVFFNTTTNYAHSALFVLLFRQAIACYCIYRLGCFKPKVTGK